MGLPSPVVRHPIEKSGTAYSEKPGVSCPETQGPGSSSSREDTSRAPGSLQGAEQAGLGHSPGSESRDSESKAVAPAALEWSQTWALKLWDPGCSRVPGQAAGLANVEIAGSCVVPWPHVA